MFDKEIYLEIVRDIREFEKVQFDNNVRIQLWQTRYREVHVILNNIIANLQNDVPFLKDNIHIIFDTHNTSWSKLTIETGTLDIFKGSENGFKIEFVPSFKGQIYVIVTGYSYQGYEPNSIVIKTFENAAELTDSDVYTVVHNAIKKALQTSIHITDSF